MHEYIQRNEATMSLTGKLGDITHLTAIEGIRTPQPVITPRRLPFTDNTDESGNAPHDDISNLSAAELKRKRARERYASMSIEQKEERNKKAHEYRKLKKEASQTMSLTKGR
ncbi:hypothetical protein E2562_037871 [Oryza meyeriana var. granulata]|uniref:Uncharacterized protein n=1 Tax=Oryza meyeriana var. granulata TaxID=110450 RepID=A0A6G1ETU7_9ORYZ|nr:hypothetical protein E2562_037871 [Oryza meyeriana var. granulata]